MNAPTIKVRAIGTMLGIAGALCVSLAAQAGETPAPAQKSVVVRYADLNLDTAAGTKALYGRISMAAKRACGSQPYYQDLGGKERFRSCFDDTMNDAVQQVGIPQLQALHNARVSARNVG